MIIEENVNYMTLKEVYMNLCVSRNSIIKKLDLLEKNGYVRRIKNKRPEIYISKDGYEFLKNNRMKYIDELMENEKDKKMKKMYKELRDAIGNPELWFEHHNKECTHHIYIENQKKLDKI